MKKITYQLICMATIALLILSFIGSTEINESADSLVQTNEEQIEHQSQQTTETLQENANKEISQEEIKIGQQTQENKTKNIVQKEDLIVPLEKINIGEQTQENTTQETTKEILIPLEEINKTFEENKTHIELINESVPTKINNTMTINKTTEENSTIEKNETTKASQKILEHQNTKTSSTMTKEIPKEETEKIIETQKPEEVEKIYAALSKNNKIEFEGEISENFDINSIEKKESTIDEDAKEVIVKSGEHLADPLTVYTDIPEVKESQISKVSVFWVNEEKEVDITGFYDLDQNGLYDRISWVVPHLSEQIFEIRINSISTTDTTSPEIKIIRESPTPTNDQIINQNYVEFNFSINYTTPSAIKCNFSLNDFFKEITTTSSWEENQTDLQDGSYSWHLLCYDQTNSTINYTEEGEFTINETYSAESPDPFYVLDWDNNFKGTPNTAIDLSSTNAESIKIELKKGTTPIDTETYNGNSATYNLSEAGITQSGEYQLITTYYHLAEPYVETYNFSVAKVDLEFESEEVEINEETNIIVTITSPRNVDFIGLDCNDGGTGGDGYATNTKTHTFSHSFAEEGTYTIDIDVEFEEDKTYSFSKNEISVEDPGDNEKPVVTLIDPEDKKILTTDNVDFSYKVTDNVNTKNCTYELYMYENGVGTLDYTTTKTNPEHNTKITVSLKDFKDANYSWNVYCCDTSGNCNGELDYDRDFEINTNTTKSTISKTEKDYDEKEALEATISKLDNFMVLKDSLSLDEEEALNDLGLAKNLTYYKKRLTQIEQDFTTNLKFITDETLKNQRKQKLKEEFQGINNKIPTNFEVTDSNEFTKNSITKNLEELASEYSKAKDITLSKNQITQLAKLNKEIQKYLSTAYKIKEAKIDYSNKTENFVLVTKEFDLKNESFSTILEVLPEEYKNPEFITKATKLSETVYEIPIDDLEEDKITYIIKDLRNTKAGSDTDTLLFQNFVVKENSITGFFLFGDGTGSWGAYLLFIILVGVLIYLGMIIVSKSKIAKYKKEEDVRRILKSIEIAKDSLKKHDTERAKKAYYKIKELYPLVPEGFKKRTTKEFKKIRLGIDRREIIGLVKEYERAKDEGRTEDKKRLYENVKKTYKRLPKKDREKVYNKMFKTDWDL